MEAQSADEWLDVGLFETVDQQRRMRGESVGAGHEFPASSRTRLLQALHRQYWSRGRLNPMRGSGVVKRTAEGRVCKKLAGVEQHHP